MVLPPFQINSLADLKPKVSRIVGVQSAEELIELASAIKRWTEARFAGDVISTIRRDTSLAALEDAFVASVCGKPWHFIEEDVRDSQKSLSALTNQVNPGRDSGFGKTLFDSRYQLVEATPTETAALLLTMSARVSYELSHMSPVAEEKAYEFLEVLLRLLRLNKINSESLPVLSRDCAAFALRNPILMRLIRFSSFCKATLASTKPLALAGGDR
jgi:hypothetical protein